MSSRRSRFAAAFVAACGMVVLSIGGCGDDSAIVGGACATGYVDCDNTCVDVSVDPKNCGACGNACAPNVACVAGVCGGALPDGSIDGALDAPDDGSLGDGRFREAGKDAPDASGDATDGSNDGVNDGPADVTVDQCTPPYVTAQHCGDCFTVCSGVNDTCKPVDGGAFACAPLCPSPLSECSATCVDETSDPTNCGLCGRICASNLCVAGVCQGATPGSIIVVGHDFFLVPSGSAQARVLTNSVFLSSSNPLRVLSFEHYANATAVTRVKAILNATAQQIGRTLVITATTTDTDIPTNLKITSYDVLLVYDLETATSAQLATLGASWAATLTLYTKSGGVVVALDGAAGTAQMPVFETSSGLLAVTANTPLSPGTPVMVQAPGDAVGLGVLSPYGVGKHSAHYATTEANGGNVVYVVVDPTTSEPVVVHKIVP